MLAKGEELVFDFNDCRADSVEVEIRLLPNHPIDGEQLGFILSLDNKYSAPITYETKGRSEEWKENVLRNQAHQTDHSSCRKKKKTPADNQGAWRRGCTGSNSAVPLSMSSELVCIIDSNFQFPFPGGGEYKILLFNIRLIIGDMLMIINYKEWKRLGDGLARRTR